METSVDKCLAFCQSLAMSGKKFSFSLSIGEDNFSFNNKELESSSCLKKKKSPSQIRREQRRKEERTLKKAAESTGKVVEASKSEENVSTVNSVEYQCSQCDSKFKAEEDLNDHIGVVHTAPVLPTHEKERSSGHIPDLALTPIHGQRNEEDMMRSPPPPLALICNLMRGQFQGEYGEKCGETFTSEDDLRVHVHIYHQLCSREKYQTPCPWDACISHEVT